MKYVSIDIETGGLDAQSDSLLSVALIIEDTSEPKPLEKLRRVEFIVAHQQIVGNPIAFKINQQLISDIADFQMGKPVADDSDTRFFVRDIEELNREIKGWLTREVGEDEKINIAGKNFGCFDDLFLKKNIANWADMRRQRMIDPAAYYARAGDENLPNLKECLRRAEMEPTDHHNAMADAWDVIRLLRAAEFCSG